MLPMFAEYHAALAGEQGPAELTTDERDGHRYWMAGEAGRAALSRV